jgi:rubrerythrin
MLEIEQAQLRDRFQVLLAQEQQALRVYEQLAAQASDPEIRDMVEHLLRDKRRHVELTERLLEIVE